MEQCEVDTEAEEAGDANVKSTFSGVLRGSYGFFALQVLTYSHAAGPIGMTPAPFVSWWDDRSKVPHSRVLLMYSEP